MELIQEVTLKDALKKYFGFNEFRGKQEEVIKNLIEGNDTFVIMPTGAGKSLCYQLPATIMQGTALVISPLIALMKNQVDQLRAHGIEAGFLNSSMNRGDYETVKQKVLDGVLKLLYVAPESLVKEEFIDFLKRSNVSFVAVDESHCISEWGHDFRPEYRRIREILNQIKDVPIIALTATATPKVQLDIRLNLQMEDSKLYITSFNRENLYYEVRPKVDAVPQIIKFIKKNLNKSGIVYCLSRRKVEEIAEILNVNGIRAVPYHAGLDSNTRTKHQDMFLNEGIQVVVATIAFGMGIDKPDVRFVIHYDVPKSIESYYQETGRAGRDGLEGNCILFYDFNDIVKLEKFMKDKPVSERESGRLLLYEMASFSESGVCRRKSMLHYFGENFDGDLCKGMCDNHRHPPELYNGMEHAILGIKCCEEVGESFGITHMVHVLRGATNQQVMLNEHNLVSVYGKCSELTDKAMKSIFSQLIIHDFLIKDIDNYGVICLSEKGKKFLENPEEVTLIKYRDFEEIKRREEEHISEEFKTYDLDLFEKLKVLRKELATKKGIPPYVIFQDPSLEDMATKYPITKEEFQNVSGVGSGKAAKFSGPFISLISEYIEENNIERPEAVVVKTAPKRSMNKLFFIQHVDRKTPLDDIARLKGLKYQELLDQLEAIIYSGTKLNLDYYIMDEIDEEKIDDIYDYFMSAETDDLNVAQDELGIDFSSEEIQLVRAKFISEVAN